MFDNENELNNMENSTQNNTINNTMNNTDGNAANFVYDNSYNSENDIVVDNSTFENAAAESNTAYESGTAAENNTAYESNAAAEGNTTYESSTAAEGNTTYESSTAAESNTTYESSTAAESNTTYENKTAYTEAAPVQSNVQNNNVNGYNGYNANNYNQNGYSQNYNMNGQMNYNSQYRNGYNQQNRQYYNNQNNGCYNTSNQNNGSYNASNQNNAANNYNQNRNGYAQNYNMNEQRAYNNQNWNNNNGGQQVNVNNKPKKAKKGIFKKIVAIVASAALFGVVAGGVMYGVYYTGTELYPVNNNSNVSLPISSSSITATSSSVSEDAEGITAKMDVAAVAQASMPAMVALEGTVTVTSSSFWGGFGSQSYEASTSGTGIIVSKNDTELLLLTNAHVVEDVNNLQCVFVDGEKVSCVVKGMKSDKDIAVVAVNLSDIKSETMSQIAIAELGSSEDVVLGQEVVAIGNALGEGQSVTNGIISALDRSITVDGVTFEGLFMTNAAINSGNSGGALLNADGKVIGINFAKTSEDGVEGMAYAIPVSNVRDLIDSLMNRQTRTKVDESERGYLGIAGMDITNDMATYYKYPQGLLLTTIEDNSAASKAGLTKNDIIVGFDDQTVSSMSGLQTIMQYYKAGETVVIEYYHLEGNQYVLKTTEVTLDKRSK